MNLFKIWKGYRTFGIGYGLPYIHLDFGFGMRCTPEEVVYKLPDIGVNQGDWVVLRNNPLAEKGIGILVEMLKIAKLKVELEADGDEKEPGWFSHVDRWIVLWKENSRFNFGALRPRQDMLVCNNGGMDTFLKETLHFPALKALISDDPESIWDNVKNLDVRVYKGGPG